MPWQPFRRRIRHKQLNNDEQVETSFDDHLSRSISDGNLVRTSSERFLLTSLSSTKSYGTCSAPYSCSSSSSSTTSFSHHQVEQGETLAGIALRYNITIQDLKVANKLWTNEGLWPGRILRIPNIEVTSTNLDLSGSSCCSGDSLSNSSSSSSSGSTAAGGGGGGGGSSWRRPSQDSLPHTHNSLGNSPHSSPFSKPHRIVADHCTAPNGPAQGPRASVEDLQDFLSKMDTSIASHKKTTISLIKKSQVSEEDEEREKQQLTRRNTVDVLSGGGHLQGSHGSSSAATFNNNLMPRPRPPVTDPFDHIC